MATKSRVRTTVLTLAVLGAVAGGIYWVLSDDERPIRVRNGSMEILAASDPGNEWGWASEPGGDNVDPTPSYSHEPRDHYFDRDKDLWVKVVRRSGTCAQGDTTSGRVVRVEYSENNFAATFKRGKSGVVNYRTKVRPSGDLNLDANGKVLRYGTAGVGRIAAVRVNNWSCTFNEAAELEVIYICSSEDRVECQ